MCGVLLSSQIEYYLYFYVGQNVKCEGAILCSQRTAQMTKKTCFDYLFESCLKQACTVCQRYVSISCCDLCDVCTHADVLCMRIISFSCCVTLLLLERLKFYFISVMAVQFLIGSVFHSIADHHKQIDLHLFKSLLNVFVFSIPSQICAGEAGRGHTEETAVRL